MEYIFIYGTLKRNYRNNSRLKGIFISEAKTFYKFPMYENGDDFPYLENIKNKGYFIKGEIWKIEKSEILNLDEFEGVPFLYKREKIKIKGFKNVYTYFKTKNIDLSKINLIDNWIE